MIKKLFQLLNLFLIVIAVSLSIPSCSKESSPEKAQKEFDQFLYNLFVDEVQSDSLSLNYSLSQPDKYGIEHPEISLGEYTIEEMDKSLKLTQNYLNELKSFDPEILTPNQELTYDITLQYLENALALGQYPLYNECLGPTTGVQAQLPILLAEFSFYEKEDIDRYLELLPCVYDYFEDIIGFQQEKSKKGLFMNDDVADSIINQCATFIENPEENFLIEYFDQKIEHYHGLTDVEVNSYKKTNKEAVMNYIVPAYELLIESLQELKGSGVNNGGLSNLPQGKEYYASLVSYKTGSDKSMKEMANMLDNAVGDGILKMTTLLVSDPLLMDKYMAFQSFPITDPENILLDLKNKIAKDFPEPLSVNCNIKYVHESLEEYLSPAMYLVPALDDYTNNSIYINGDNEENLSMIYTTVAHEGYPGHLYQNVYFRHQNPAPIRTLMNFMGYDEGWATYVEMYSYHLSGIDEGLAEFLAVNNILILSMYARADMGIHYDGWSKSKAVAYIEGFTGDRKLSEDIYFNLLEEAGVFLPYAVGYLELVELREKAEDSLGENFVLKDFHEFVLDIGPSQFNIIDSQLDLWIEEANSK